MINPSYHEQCTYTATRDGITVETRQYVSLMHAINDADPHSYYAQFTTMSADMVQCDMARNGVWSDGMVTVGSRAANALEYRS